MGESLNNTALVLNHIKEYRTRKNVKQEELAKGIDVTRTYLSKLENQKFAPSADLMHKICKYFRVGLGEMKLILVNGTSITPL